MTLLGQNVNSYRDTSTLSFPAAVTSSRGVVGGLSAGFETVYRPRHGGVRFSELLSRVADVDAHMRVRFTSPHPKDFPDDVNTRSTLSCVCLSVSLSVSVCLCLCLSLCLSVSMYVHYASHWHIDRVPKFPCLMVQICIVHVQCHAIRNSDMKSSPIFGFPRVSYLLATLKSYHQQWGASPVTPVFKLWPLLAHGKWDLEQNGSQLTRGKWLDSRLDETSSPTICCW